MTTSTTTQHRYVVQAQFEDSGDWETAAGSFETENDARARIYEVQGIQRSIFGPYNIEIPTRILDTETGEATEVPW